MPRLEAKDYFPKPRAAWLAWTSLRGLRAQCPDITTSPSIFASRKEGAACDDLFS